MSQFTDKTSNEMSQEISGIYSIVAQFINTRREKPKLSAETDRATLVVFQTKDPSSTVPEEFINDLRGEIPALFNTAPFDTDGKTGFIIYNHECHLSLQTAIDKAKSLELIT